MDYLDILSYIYRNIFKKYNLEIYENYKYFMRDNWNNLKNMKIILKNTKHLNNTELKEVKNTIYNIYFNVFSYCKILHLEEDYEIVYLMVKLLKDRENFYNLLEWVLSCDKDYPNKDNLNKIFYSTLPEKDCKFLLLNINLEILKIEKLKEKKEKLEKTLYGKKIVKFIEKEMDDEFEMKPMRTKIDMNRIKDLYEKKI